MLSHWRHLGNLHRSLTAMAEPAFSLCCLPLLTETVKLGKQRRSLNFSMNTALESHDWILSRPHIFWAGSKRAARSPTTHLAAPDVKVAKSLHRRKNKVCFCFSVSICWDLFRLENNSYILIYFHLWFNPKMLKVPCFTAFRAEQMQK